jgi:adenylate kinase family enzyme
MNSLILLTGIPGTGKTTLAKYLEDNYGYYHMDLEIPWHNNTFPKDERGFKKLIYQIPKDKTIISWGFPTWLPHYIKYIESIGFRHVWLDGDRKVAFKNFIKREKGGLEMEKAFYRQVEMIDSSDIVNLLKPTILNPYTNNGEFKNIQRRAEEITNL